MVFTPTKLVTAMSLILWAQGLALAQTGSKDAVFEVASVRRAAPTTAGATAGGQRRSSGLGSSAEDPGLVSYRNTSLKSLLIRAYNLKPIQIGGPAWLDSERYDVVAKIPEGASRQQIPAMLRNLLVERFRISLHWETKEESVYVLRVGKGGPKLKLSDEDGGSSGAESGGESRLPKSMAISSAGGITLKGATMAAFADLLSTFLARPVLDSTGVQGKFDIFLDVPTSELLRGQRMEAAEGPEDSSSLAASTFTAVRALGLKLDPQKWPMKHLVIDRAEKTPTEN